MGRAPESSTPLRWVILHLSPSDRVGNKPRVCAVPHLQNVLIARNAFYFSVEGFLLDLRSVSDVFHNSHGV